MAQFKIPEPKKIYPLDLSTIGGCDEYSTTPSVNRSPDMKNIVNRLGMHRVRTSIEQTYIVAPKEAGELEDDIDCEIKWVGKIEEYDSLGNPIPYFIKISEHLEELNAKDMSYIYISVWPTPDVRNIGFDMSNMPGCEKYEISYKKFNFTNYGPTGNEKGLYEEVNYDGKTYVFSPIGILSFDCKTVEQNDKKQLEFTVKNVLDDPYVPTIKIAGTPDGLDGEIYESINLLTDKRKCSCAGTATATEFVLPEKVLTEVISVKKLNNDGTTSTLVENQDYTVNLLTGTVTFTSAPGVSPKAGADNVFFEYSKSPFEGNQTNVFEMNGSSNNRYLKTNIQVTKALNPNDSEKIDVQLRIKIQKDSGYNSNCYLKQCSLNVEAGGIKITDPIINLDNSQMNTIRDGSVLTINKSYTILNDGSLNRKWSAILTDTITITTTTSSTTGVPGSVGSNTSMGTQTYSPASGLNLQISARAVPHLGSNSDGSDSYWDVYASPRVNTPYNIQASGTTVYGEIDGDSSGLATGGMHGSGTWPSSGEVSKRIYYSPGKSSVSIRVWAPLNITWSGKYIGTVYSSYYTLSLPNITPNSQKTTTTTNTSDRSDNVTSTFDETLKENNDTSIISYENNAKTSARLACYYSTHATAVYGYENDRRIFVTNGGNCDTFTGNPIDDNYSTITYFPDTNYHVLGEESNVLGYAQKAGYLYTIKEGGDSLYIRKSAAVGKVLEFPSLYVKRNLQVLCRPIEIEGSVFIITRNGLEEISYDYVQNYTYELVTYLRSYYISNYFKLGADYKYKQMQWYYENGLLHVFLDNYVFVFDLESKSYVYELSSSTGGGQKTGLPYQFEAYVCTIPALNANVFAPKINVYLPKDFERKDYGIVNTDILPYGYNNRGIYKFDYSGSKVDKLKQVIETNNLFDKTNVLKNENCVFGEFDNSIYIEVDESNVNSAYIAFDMANYTKMLDNQVTLSVENVYKTGSAALDIKIVEYKIGDQGNEILFDNAINPYESEENSFYKFNIPATFVDSDAIGYVVCVNLHGNPLTLNESVTLDSVQLVLGNEVLPYNQGGYRIIDKWYPIRAHYYTPFIDFNMITQLKTTKQIHIGTQGNNNDEYYIGYVLPDGQQLLLDKIINSSNDTQTSFRNSSTPFPKIIAIRNKIRKFTSVKLFIMNKADYEDLNEVEVGSNISEYNNMTFDRITIQYVIAGKYRGE